MDQRRGVDPLIPGVVFDHLRRGGSRDSPPLVIDRLQDSNWPTGRDQQARLRPHQHLQVKLLRGNLGRCRSSLGRVGLIAPKVDLALVLQARQLHPERPAIDVATLEGGEPVVERERGIAVVEFALTTENVMQLSRRAEGVDPRDRVAERDIGEVEGNRRWLDQERPLDPTQEDQGPRADLRVRAGGRRAERWDRLPPQPLQIPGGRLAASEARRAEFGRQRRWIDPRVVSAGGQEQERDQNSVHGDDPAGDGPDSEG